MIRKIQILGTIILSMLSLSVFAQSFTLDNVTYTVTGSIDDDHLEALVEVINSSSSTKNVHVKRSIIRAVAGSDNNFCWGTNCYPPETTISTSSEQINPGNLNSTFRGDYYSNGNSGMATIRYTFYDASNPADSIGVNIDYEAYITSVKRLAKYEDKNYLNNAFPNPAISTASVEFSTLKNAKNAKIIISNMIGSTVKEIVLHENKGVVTFPVNSLESGFYFYSLQVDGKNVATKRLIVNH